MRWVVNNIPSCFVSCALLLTLDFCIKNSKLQKYNSEILNNRISRYMKVGSVKNQMLA